MHLRNALQVLAITTVALLATALSASAAQADGAPAGLGVTVQIDAGGGPVVVLTNHGTIPCQVSSMALGTIDLTSVQQSGAAVAPIAIVPSFDDDLGYTLSQHLTTLAAGASLPVPLNAVAAGPTGHALRTVSWSPVVTVGALYPLDPAKSLSLTANYTAPDLIVSGAPLCAPGPTSTAAQGTVTSGSGTATSSAGATAVAGATAIAAPGGAVAAHRTGWVKWVVLAAVLLVLLVIALAATLRMRSRRRSAGGALVVVLLAATLGLGTPAPKAVATVTGSGGAAAAVAGCVAGFNAPGGDPAGIMKTLNNPSVNVTVNLDTSDNGENRLDQNNIFIYWNPNDTSPLSGGTPRVPCDELYHEMYHAFEDTTPQGVDVHECFDQAGKPTGIAIKEVHATEAENKLRASRHEPLRTVYGPNALPPGGCRPPKPEDPLCHPTRGCPLPPTKKGQTTADPHLTTFDGRRFDFQAAGEFVVTRDTAAADPATALQIQVREQPWPGSRQISVNTAMAANVAGDRVEVLVDNGQMKVLVNSANHPLSSGKLPKGGDLVYTPRNAGPFLTIDWPDQSYALVTLYNHTLTLIVVPAPVHSGHLTGLLGNADGDPANDLHLASGAATGPPTYSDLYPAFADSLRVAQQNSLFTYEPGTSTQTYTDRTFPDRNPVPSSRRAWAEAVCVQYGITDPVTLADCVVDLANTGSADFLAASLLTQAAATSFRLGGGSTTVAITRAGQKTTVPFAGTAGQKLYVDVVASTLPSNCGQLTLQDPKGHQLASGCIINGKGGIDVVVLPVTGTYLVVVAPPEGVTGSVSMRLVSATDQQGGLSIDGPPATIAVTTAGGIGRLTFSGQQGEVIYADIPTATLPGSCGSISIHDPQDKVLATGCVINGTGSIDRITLPAAGTYSFVLDPADAAIGSVQVRLNRATDQIGRIGVDGPAVTATVAQPGAVVLLSFSGSAGEKVYVGATAATIPGECGVIFLRDSAGGQLNTGCVINGEGDVDATVLKESGTYTVGFDPSAAVVGSVVFRLIRDTDEQGAIAIGGATVTATIGQPGAVSRFTFQGSAGQKVAVVATGSTLPSGCGLLQLRDAAAGTLTTGCVLDGKGGIDSFALATTGSFTVVVDPEAADTGQVQLQLTAG